MDCTQREHTPQSGDARLLPLLSLLFIHARKTHCIIGWKGKGKRQRGSGEGHAMRTIHPTPATLRKDSRPCPPPFPFVKWIFLSFSSSLHSSDALVQFGRGDEAVNDATDGGDTYNKGVLNDTPRLFLLPASNRPPLHGLKLAGRERERVDGGLLQPIYCSFWSPWSSPSMFWAATNRWAPLLIANLRICLFRLGSHSPRTIGRSTSHQLKLFPHDAHATRDPRTLIRRTRSASHDLLDH